MARFLFCPLASHGYVYPMAGIALALRARGHDVAFATGTEFAADLEGQGITRIARSDPDGPSFEVRLWFDPLAVAIQIKHVERAVDVFKPDVIVASQLAHGPLLVAERHEIPVAVLGFAAYLWPSRRQADRAPESADERRRVWHHDGLLDAYNRVRRMYRLDPAESDYVNGKMLGDLFMVQSIPELEPESGDLPPRVHLVGACLWEPGGEDAEIARWTREPGPLLYVQHGRTFGIPRFWPHLIQACHGRPVRVIASVGRMDGATGNLPASFLVRSHVPQGAVLPRAAGVVCGGNTTAVLGGLVHGVPMVLIPAGSEQPDIAERCARAATAIVLAPESVTEAALGDAIAQLLSSSRLRSEAARLQAAFARTAGLERASDLLEELARARSPVLRCAG